MKAVILDDSFSGEKLEHIEMPKKMDVEKVLAQIMSQIDEKLKNRTESALSFQ